MHKELVEERLSQLAKAIKIDELKKDKEALTKELREAKTITDGAKPDLPPQRLKNHSEEGVVKAKEQKNDPSASSSYVPWVLKKILLPETEDDSWPKELGDENDGSASSIGDVTPTSSDNSM